MPLPSLAGKTVAIIGNAPNMSAAQCPAADYTIAVSFGLAHAPNAEAHVAIDGNLPDANYAGLRLVGVPGIEGAEFVYMPYDEVELAPGHTVHIRNNTLSAIRLAADAGAAHVLVAGQDVEAYEAFHNFQGLKGGLAAIINEMASREIPVRVEVLPPPVAQVAAPTKRPK